MSSSVKENQQLRHCKVRRLLLLGAVVSILLHLVLLKATWRTATEVSRFTNLASSNNVGVFPNPILGRNGTTIQQSPHPTLEDTTSNSAVSPRDRIDDLRVIFVHIPKAGGSALSAMLQSCFQPTEPQHQEPMVEQQSLTVCPIGRTNPFDHVCERGANIIRSTVRNVRTRFMNAKDATNTSQKGMDEKTRCMYLETHYDYSLVENVVKPLALQQQQNLQVVTLLRDPITREPSAWRYRSQLDGILAAPDDYISREIKERTYAFMSNYTQKDLIRQKYGCEHNHMVRQLAGILWRCSQKPLSEANALINDPQRLLATAKANLASMDHVLIYEDFGQISTYLQCAFGCNVSVPTQRYQQKGKFNKTSEIPQVLLDELRRHNSLDIELYNYAEKLYRERLATMCGIFG